MQRLALGLASLTGWRRAATAAGLGAVAALALPPAYFTPIWWLCLPALIWLLRGEERARGAFWTGWWFGFGHFIFGLYWIAFAPTVDVPRFWWAIPLALVGLPMLLAVFTGAMAAAFVAMRRRLRLTGIAEALSFALAWIVVEWLRGHVFTGFPWNLAGYGWSAWLPVLQVVSVTGVYGLSLLTVAAASLPAGLVGPGRRGSAIACLAGIALFVALAGWGASRMQGTQARVVPGVTLRIVQGNIPQRLKADPGARLANFQTYLDLSASPGAERITHLVWPETAVPWLMVEGHQSQLNIAQAIGRVTPPGGLALVGAPRGVADGGNGKPRYWNSMLAIDSDGRIVATYDKAHLVPFGEYMPLRRYLPAGVAALAAGAGDYTAGPGPRTLALAGLPPVSPLVCYEVIFPGKVAPDGDAGAAAEQGRPAWLLNLTNDAWYGRTAGPHQHFEIARVRAVEEGLPMVRAANTGISGVVDPYGRVTASLGLDRAGVIDTALPSATAAPTPYGRWGDRVLGLLLFSMMLTILFFSRRV